jgi:hypothetical protein
MHLRGMNLRLGMPAMVLMAVTCVDYPVRVERVDADQLRVMDFVYVNLSDTTGRLREAAPGDSMLLIACFSGVPVHSIDFDVSWNVFSSPYGFDTAYDRSDLEYETVVLDTNAFTDSTDVVAIKFRIPDNVLARSASIDESVVGALGFDKAQLLALVDAVADMTPEERADDSLFTPLLEQYAGAVMQILSAPITLQVTVNEVNRIKSDLTVRYNRHFREYPGVYINRNPIVSFVGLYKIRGTRSLSGLGDLRDGDSTFRLYAPDTTFDPALMGRRENLVDSDTILIEPGYTYYLAVDSGVFAGRSVLDSSQALLFNVDDGSVTLAPVRPERFSTLWWNQPVAEEAAGVASEDLFVTQSGGGILCAAYPPLTTAISKVTLWVQVFDEFWGEWHRPRGSALVETELHFRYSEAYVDSLGR